VVVEKRTEIGDVLKLEVNEKKPFLVVQRGANKIDIELTPEVALWLVLGVCDVGKAYLT